VRGPFLPAAFARVRPRRVGSVGSAPSARHVGGLHVCSIERGRCGSRAVAVLSEGTSGTRGDYGVLKGHPSLWGTVRGYGRGTWLLWVRRSTAERPSPLRVCSDLSNNKLNGSVPSSLSALTKLRELCVAPSCCACGRRGSDRSALLRACGMSGGCMSGASKGAVRQQGCCGALKRGLRARDVTKEYASGTPSYGVQCAGTVGAHGCCGCRALPPSGRVRFGCADTSRTIN
jgi:hypothetical protein